MKKPLVLIFAALVIFLSVSACGKSNQSGSAAKPDKSAPRGASKNAPAGDASLPRPLELVSGEKVASMAGGSLLGAPVEVGKKAVEYSVKLPDGATENYTLAFRSASFEKNYQLPLWKEQKKEIENISGLWDEAYFALSEVRSGGTLIVISQGDMGLEVGGDRKEVIIAIAEEAIAKLK